MSLIPLAAAGPNVATGGAALSGSYVTTVGNTANTTTYTFSGTSIGTAASDRTVVIMFGCRFISGASTASSVTIGGVTADIDINLFTANHCCVIARAEVPTGTTADIVVTMDAGGLRAGCSVYRVTGGTLSVSSSTTSTGATASSAESLTLSTTATDGFAIGGVTGFTWSSATWANLTEDYDDIPNPTESQYRHGVASDATSGSSLAVTCTPGGTDSEAAFAAIAYGGS